MAGITWRSLKRVSLRAIRTIGGFQLLLDSAWRRRRLLILCYHGVSIDDEHEWNSELYMPLDGLRTRLEILRRARCSVLPLSDAVERLYAGSLPQRSVAVTFDDGYFDFSSRARPALREFEVPVTVYLTTLRCEQNRPIFRLVCSYMLWKARGRRFVAPEPRISLDLRSVAARADALASIIRVADGERLDVEGKHRLAERIADALGVDYRQIEARRLLTIMTPDEVRALAQEGVDFQLHTHTHTTPLAADSFTDEIVQNRRRIERMTMQTAAHFCYPSGVYRPEFLPWLTAQRVVSATTCDPGLATRATHPLLLPRFVDVTGVSPVEFEGWLSGAASLISRNRSYADGGV